MFEVVKVEREDHDPLLPIINLPLTGEDLIHNFTTGGLQGKLIGDGWQSIDDFLTLEGLVHLWGQLLLPGSITVEDAQRLLDGDRFDYRGWGVQIRLGIFRVTESEQPEYCLLIQIDDPLSDGKGSAFLDTDHFCQPVSDGEVMTIVWQSNEEGVKLMPFFTLRGLRSLFIDAAKDSDYWLPCNYLRDVAIEGAEIQWAKAFPDCPPIEIDIDSLQPDPEREFCCLAQCELGKVRISFELSECGIVKPYFDYMWLSERES